MAKDNPMNPHKQTDEQVRRVVQPPVAKAKVVQARPHDRDDEDQKAYHTARVRVYGEQSTQVAPVLVSLIGDAYVPPVGSDVAVMYGPNEKPWIVGSWYAVNEDVEPPNYQPGERVIGHPRSDSSIKFDANGDIILDPERNLIGGGDYSDEDAQDAIGGILSSQFTYDDVGDAINLNPHAGDADAHHTRYTDEEAQDAAAAIVNGGTNITTTYDDANNLLTIDTSALDQEEVEDTVAALLQGSTGVGITYDDTNDTLTIDIDTHIGNSSAHHSRYTDSEVLSVVGDSSNDVNIGVEDTRDTNEAPTFFDNEVSYDFKRTSTIGVPASGTYCGLMTFAPWRNDSGDQSHQVAYTNDGLFLRSAFPNSSSWNAWTKIGDENKVFLAEGSTTNINQTTTVSWSSTTFNDNAYSWDGSSQLTIEKAGRYEIHAEADFTSSGDTRQNPNLFIHQNNNIVGVGGRSGYVRDRESHNNSSVHSHAVISANSGDVIDVESRAEADTTGSVTPNRAMFYVKRIENNATDTPTLGYFDAHLTTTQMDAENGIYVNFAESINENDGWTVDSASQISPEESGKYKIDGSVNFNRTGTDLRNVMYAELEVNGTRLTERTRGTCYIRNNASGDEGDATFSTVISLNAGDDVRVFANEERGGETGNDVERASINITKIQ